MQTDKIQFSDLRYNPERSAFEAIVRIHDRGISYEYPAHVCAPLEAEFDQIAHGLVENAQRAHRSGRAGLRMRKAAAPAQMVHRSAPQRQEVPLMMRMLRAMAA